MTAPTPIVIFAAVEAFEQPAVIAGAELLSEALGLAAGSGPWPVQLGFTALNRIPASPKPTVIIASLAMGLGGIREPFPEIEARWRGVLPQLQSLRASLYLCTVFRHVSGRDGSGQPSALIEHIRRLNRLSAELSHDFNTGIIDFDRVFAHVGGSILETDFRLSGAKAAQAGGHTIAWCLLSFGLDDSVDPDLQEKAKALLGGLDGIDALIERRLAKRGLAVPSAPGHG